MRGTLKKDMKSWMAQGRYWKILVGIPHSRKNWQLIQNFSYTANLTWEFIDIQCFM